MRSMFKWTGLPDTVSSWEVEKHFILFGCLPILTIVSPQNKYHGIDKDLLLKPIRKGVIENEQFN